MTTPHTKPSRRSMKPFNAKTDILALDFDGVIADSIEECLVSGYNAYAEFTEKPTIERPNELPEGWIDKAREIRNFIRKGEDYVYIMYSLALNVPIHNQKHFDDFKARYIDLKRIFLELFTSQRLSYAENKPEQWTELTPLYNGMKTLDNYPNKANLYIVTTKRLLFVRKILNVNNIKLLDDNLFDTSGNRTKKGIIENILQTRKIEPSRAYFFDDQITTLITVKSAGVHAILAGWGYNNQQQVEQAHAHNIPVMSLDDFMTFCKGS